MVCSFFVAQCRARKNNSSYKTQAVLVWIDTHFAELTALSNSKLGSIARQICSHYGKRFVGKRA
jgi:hypothetical protein